MKWNGDYSDDGRWMLNEASIDMGRGVPRGREVLLCRSKNDAGGPPYEEVRIYNTRREAKAVAEELSASDG